MTPTRKAYTTIARFFLTAVIALTAMSCVTNNGDIGDFYGIWHLRSVDIDGVEQTSWNDNGETFTTWNFQNNIITVKRNNHRHDYSYVTGTWTSNDSELTLNFTHSDDNTPAGTGGYAAPAWIYMPQGITTLSFKSRSSKRMVLTARLPDGRQVTYSLEKQS